MNIRSPSTGTDGGLPEFWDRSVLFFANLMALFFGNRAETACLAGEVGEIDSYGGRLIPILNLLFRGGGNVLVLEHEPDPALCRYFSDQLGLDLPWLEIMHHREYDRLGERIEADPDDGITRRLERLAEAVGRSWIDGYVTDPTLEALAGRLGMRTVSSHRGSWRGNNKLLLLDHVRGLGLPQAETTTAASPAEVEACAARLARRGYRAAVLKAQIGASGIGMLRLPEIGSGSELPEIPEHLFFEGPCLVQGWLEPGVLGVTSVRSPSVQLFVDDLRVLAFDLTEQILGGDSVHEGNEAPPPAFTGPDENAEVVGELMRQARVAGEWLRDQGYRGTASVDFLVVGRHGTRVPEVHICELNARVTGATYPAVLARHFLPGGAWLLRNLRLGTPAGGGELLALLDRGGRLFRPEAGRGVLPLNFNFGRDGLVHKGQFLCLAEDGAACRELLAGVQAELPVDSRYERD